jgi:hypothetical protein
MEGRKTNFLLECGLCKDRKYSKRIQNFWNFKREYYWSGTGSTASEKTERFGADSAKLDYGTITR